MGGKIVLVIAAHPDDEILGAGATFAKRVRAGDKVHAVVLCEGESLRYSSAGREVHQQEDARKAASVIGFSSFRCLMMPEQRLDTLCQLDLNRQLEKIVDELNPQVVYTHFGGDINRDHEIVHESVLVVTRPTRHFIEEVLAFETPSSTGLRPGRHFDPDTFEDISNTLEIKIEAMGCYGSETPPFPHARSLKSLRERAAYWGSMIDRPAAEPFITLRRYR